MNKKRFLNLAVCSLLVCGMPVAMTGCKDYDDDISGINTTTDGLSQQLKALQTELAAAKDAAAAAANDVKAAQQSADQAKAEAAAATKAAADAKAAAIEAAIAEVQKLSGTLNNLTSLSESQAKEIAALAGKIEGIEKGLSNIDLTDINKKIGDNAAAIVEINKQLAAVNTQLAALDNYKTTLESLSSTFNELKPQIEKISGIESSLNELKTKVSTIAADVEANKTAIGTINGQIAEIKTTLTSLSAQISSEVSNAVNTIAGTMTQRLSSVTLIPNLYVDGIPTISFESAKYTKMVYNKSKKVWEDATEGQTQYIVSNNTTEAKYRLNPGTIKDEDIKISGMKYVSQVATTRAGEVEDDIVNVSSASVGNNGVLTVLLGKSNTASLNRTDGKINTVSLKVPIADKHLFTAQGENEASVYSEYTRLEETYFTPELAFVKGEYIAAGADNGHLSDSTTVYSSAAGAYVAKNLVYNQSYDLTKLVDGCKFFAPSTHTPLTVEQLAGYGMKINFYVAEGAYTPTTPDKTNEQRFAKISGSILTPISLSGTTGNEAIIGRQPIIRAELIDEVNKNVVDVGYFKVKFTKEDMTPVEIPWQDITSTGTPCSGSEVSITWDKMQERVLEKLGTNGMSKADFNKIYGSNITIDPTNDTMGTLTVNVNDNTDASTPVMTWSVTADQLGKLTVGSNTATFTKKVTFTDPTELHPNVVISFKWVVTTEVSAASLGKVDGLKWQNNTMKVYVVPMPVPYTDKSQKAYYATNILEGRLQPYVNGMTSCGFYDINYDSKNVVNTVDGKKLTYPGAPLQFQSGYGHWQMTAANQGKLNTVTYSIANSADGKLLASNGGKVKVDWSSNINGIMNNAYVFGSMYLEVLPILKLETVTAAGIKDDSHVVSIDVTDNIRITDAFGHEVAKVATTKEPLAADYWSYYNVNDPKFGDSSTLMIADTPDGKNKRTPASLNMTADMNTATGVLTFQNQGAPLQADAYILVPVSITHEWGTLTGTIAVPLSKGL